MRPLNYSSIGAERLLPCAELYVAFHGGYAGLCLFDGVCDLILAESRLHLVSFFGSSSVVLAHRDLSLS